MVVPRFMIHLHTDLVAPTASTGIIESHQLMREKNTVKLLW